ncbi:hypothetical protein SDC9_158132 [bioreactor metagenome]|uniref:Uncharacterized protein n=1 Tax=bioreactor metagenome TaxID=1076179 RepID=A0A645F8X5_9ZZZZ
MSVKLDTLSNIILGLHYPDNIDDFLLKEGFEWKEDEELVNGIPSSFNIRVKTFGANLSETDVRIEISTDYIKVIITSGTTIIAVVKSDFLITNALKNPGVFFRNYIDALVYARQYL